MSDSHEPSIVEQEPSRSSSESQAERPSAAASLHMDLDDQTELELAPSDAGSPEERPSSAANSNQYVDEGTELELASGSNSPHEEQSDLAASDEGVDDEIYMSDPDVSQVIQDDYSHSGSSSSSEDEEDEPKPKMTLYQRIQAVVARVRAEEEHAAQLSAQSFGQRVPTPTETDVVSSNLQAQSLIRGGNPVHDASTRDEITKDEPPRKAAEVPDEEEDPKVSKVPTLSQAAERQVLKQLKEAVTGEQTTANYCCGGVIPTSTIIEETGPRSAVFGDRTRPAVSPPVVIRWDDPTNDNLTRKIQFPLSGKSSSLVLDAFLAACQPSNGLHPTQFSTNFNLHDYGILDAINQILLPEYDGHILSNRKEHLGLVAELVKLNASALKNVDTRSS